LFDDDDDDDDDDDEEEEEGMIFSNTLFVSVCRHDKQIDCRRRRGTTAPSCTLFTIGPIIEATLERKRKKKKEKKKRHAP